MQHATLHVTVPYDRELSAPRPERLHQEGDESKINANHLPRIRDVLAHLNRVKTPEALNLPGYRLHALKGDMKGYWSVRVSGNWRIIFRFEDSGAYDVDLIDYH